MAVAGVQPEDFAGGGTIVREQTSLWMDGWRRLRRNRLALAATIYLSLLIVVALIALKWTPHDPNALSLTDNYAGPSAAFPFGGDHLGRDLLSRLMIGAQVSLVVGLGTQVIVVAVGVVLGLAAGYFRGWVDNILSLIINVFYGIPDLLVALILVVLLGSPGISKIIIAIAATRWMDMARLVRGQALSLREREFIEAAKASGAKPAKVIFGHLLPNSMGPIIVQATIGIPAAILFEAFLSYLGLGVKPPTPSWGSMSAEGVQALRLAPHVVMPPAIALVVTLLAFNFLGDGLRDAFDPRQKR
ncbi:MAG TPA: ABC transporter permease [Candidatus Dormibacteraeota bacterium]|jgi:ABC-type dipeptide/oligopeptide/nickel transport system permease subunit